MILETERLYLRRFTIEDADWMYDEIYSQPNIMRFLGRGIPLTKEQTKKSVERRIDFNTSGFGEGIIIKKINNEPIGHCGLGYLPDNNVEIAYALSEKNWGMGYATEISKAVLEWGFNKLGINRIVALVYPQNSPSIKVIEKIGLQYEKEAEYWGVKFLLYSATKN